MVFIKTEWYKKQFKHWKILKFLKFRDIEARPWRHFEVVLIDLWLDYEISIHFRHFSTQHDNFDYFLIPIFLKLLWFDQLPCMDHLYHIVRIHSLRLQHLLAILDNIPKIEIKQKFRQKILDSGPWIPDKNTF